MRRTVWTLPETVHRIANRADDINVATLAIAPDVIGFPHPTAFQYQRQRLHMIVNEQPVANVEPTAVDRHGFAVQSLDDRQWDELFRELMWSVIVRAVGEEDREPVGMAPCPDQMVRRRLAGRIRRARVVARLFGEASLIRQGAVNFIRRDMQEPKALRADAKLAQMRERNFE